MRIVIPLVGRRRQEEGRRAIVSVSLSRSRRFLSSSKRMSGFVLFPSFVLAERFLLTIYLDKTFETKLSASIRQARRNVIIVNEAYTTKTCRKCGKLNWGIGGKKIFKCPKSECGMVMDRNKVLKNMQVLGISVSAAVPNFGA